MNRRLDKKLFYERLAPFANKHTPIFIDMPINRDELHIRLIFDWTHQKPNGDFNPFMSAQLIDITKSVGHGKYITPDLYFNSIKEGVTTQYKLYKYLNAWSEKALMEGSGK